MDDKEPTGGDGLRSRVAGGDIDPRCDGALSPRLPCPGFAVWVLKERVSTNHTLRTQWESAFKREASLAHHHRHHDQTCTSPSREAGGPLAVATHERTKATKNEREENEDASQVPSGSGGEAKAVAMEETIQKLSEEVGRSVKQTASSIGPRHTTTGEPAPSQGFMQLLNDSPTTTTTTTSTTSRGGVGGYFLRPLRSPTEIFRRDRAGSRKRRHTKAKGRKSDRDDGDVGEAEQQVEEDAAVPAQVVLRREVPPADVYYFSKRNLKEGWLVKQGARLTVIC